MTREDYRLNLLNCRTKDCKTEVRISYIKSLEQQLANLKHNYEMQEIMLSDYKKRIEELESPKSCEGCKWRNCLASEMEPCNSCFRRMAFIGRLFDYYEPKDKQ